MKSITYPSQSTSNNTSAPSEPFKAIIERLKEDTLTAKRPIEDLTQTRIEKIKPIQNYSTDRITDLYSTEEFLNINVLGNNTIGQNNKVLSTSNSKELVNKYKLQSTSNNLSTPKTPLSTSKPPKRSIKKDRDCQPSTSLLLQIMELKLELASKAFRSGELEAAKHLVKEYKYYKKRLTKG